MDSNCETCAERWLEYAAATQAQFAMKRKLQIARKSGDAATVARLARAVTTAAGRRAKRQADLREHERLAHPTTKALSAGG